MTLQIIILSSIIIVALIVFLKIIFGKDYQSLKKENSRHIDHRKIKTNHTANNKENLPKGWDMNNSPFRARKSNATWGGGNIHGSVAKRGSRKPFLK